MSKNKGKRHIYVNFEVRMGVSPAWMFLYLLVPDACRGWEKALDSCEIHVGVQSQTWGPLESNQCS